MNFLLDTCVLSEFTRRKPNEKVISWLDQVHEDQLYISVITVGEVMHGIERLPESHRKTELLTWLNSGLIQRFDQRILPIDTGTMISWGSLIARMERDRRPLSAMDALIIATALHNELVIVTRNISDFLTCGIQVINPWE